MFRKSLENQVQRLHEENTAAIARAQETADKSLQTIQEHMKECSNSRLEAVKWRAQADATLERQNDALKAISSTSRKIFWFVASLVVTMFGGVVVALAIVVYDLIISKQH